MSVFDEILRKINEISNSYDRSINDDLKVAFDCIDKFAEEYQNGRGKRDQNVKKALVTTLMSIDEREDENSPKDIGRSDDGEKRLSNKRSKEQVDGMSSPEPEKRPKRNASVKAQNNISKQVNVNLTQKLRREDTETTRRRKDDKENTQPLIQVKQEKISIPPEPMETDASLDIPVVPIKQEPNKDETSMPPPAVPLPKSRKLPRKDKSTDSEEEVSGKRSTRTRKNTETMQPPPAPLPQERPARGSRRGARRSAAPPHPPAHPPPRPTTPPPAAPPQSPPPPEPRPKRTRAKKKLSESSTTDVENTQPPAGNGIGSPADKQRPKRTRRGKKAAEKEETPKPKEPTPEPEVIIPKEERISNPDSQSPAIPQKTVKKTKNSTTSVTSNDSTQSKMGSKKRGPKPKVQEETQVSSQMNTTVTISMDKTVVLANGVYDHTDGKVAIAMNETVVLDKINRGTMVLDKPQAKLMDCTVVLDKVADSATPNITDDLSLLTDDNSEKSSSPTKGNNHNQAEPTSAVKAKVQQFEEMAARTTRTKTRAMAKQTAETENSTPPDKVISKQVLSAETLAKMNNMIFNGKTTQMSSSASKPTAKLPPVKTLSASASKVTAINKAREEQLSKDDARKKKEAMLEAKKEQQKRKREEKMAAAAAAREAAEKERRANLQAQARDRMEKQAHADQGKLERMKEAERKKQELARKVAETEERRRAEEQARAARLADEQRKADAARRKQQEDSEARVPQTEERARAARLADEQRKADAARRKQQEDSEAIKKEAAMMAKEIEKRQKEYLEKQKKQREAEKMHTPLTKNGKLVTVEPAYMSDGFQYLVTDDEDDDAPSKFPSPPWNTTKKRRHQLALQHLLPAVHVDRLFSVRVHSVDLRAIFPRVERAALKRTSSAVWRTPPALQLSRVHESPV